ncbi:ninjurin-1-like [Fundulus heteroclitus]|uniref:ninjurin-1-like n=1 Tax=Fundulus heteroclitus TaxID=8078 RepID=UPI00165A54A5|nr:ninjurin-1-like [Fundulus heteroclitus]
MATGSQTGAPTTDTETRGAVTTGAPSGAPAQNNIQDRPSINMNTYANKKSAAVSMLDLALLISIAFRLKDVIHRGPTFDLYILLITLLSISLTLQIVVGIMLIFIVKWDLNKEHNHHKLNRWETFATIFTFLIMIINAFIIAFGDQQPNSANTTFPA